MSTENEKQVRAYERMLERAKQFLIETKLGVTPKLQEALNAAKEKASELGELSAEEAEKIADYLKRDLHAAGEFLAEDRGELRDWLRFDIQQVESRIADALSLLVDHTKLELAELAERAQTFGEWHTGEVTGPGTLVCNSCGEELRFDKTGHIPPCPKCRGTSYRRSRE
jgi:hypothetical protein